MRYEVREFISSRDGAFRKRAVREFESSGHWEFVSWGVQEIESSKSLGDQEMKTS